MTCDKCGSGEIVERHVHRFSPRLVLIGRFFWVTAAVGIVGATLYFRSHPPQPAPVVDVAAHAKQGAIARLLQIDNVPSGLVAAFDDTGQVPDSFMEALTPTAQAEVEEVIGDYNRTLRTAPAPVPPAAWWSNPVLWLAWVVSLALAVAGFVLTTRTETLSCGSCGAPFEGDDTSLI